MQSCPSTRMEGFVQCTEIAYFFCVTLNTACVPRSDRHRGKSRSWALAGRCE